jgi:hypothetical protein
MSGLQAGIAEMATLQEGLAATLLRTSDDIAHVESLDAEQRSEVYAILEAIRTNSQLHLATVARLARKIKGGEANA